MDDHIQYIKDSRGKTLERGFITPEIYDIYEAVFQYHGVFIEDNSVSKCPSFINDEITDDVPALDPENILLDEETRNRLITAFKGLVDGIAAVNSGFLSEALIAVFQDDPETIDRAMSFLLKRDFNSLATMAEKGKIGTEEFIFILVSWFRPYLSGLRKACFKGDTSEWFKGYCPFCGGQSDIGKIIEVKDNKRVLHCSLCDNEWKFPRLMCTICENKNHETQGFFTTEEDELYRLDYCDECKGYIKTVRIVRGDDDEKYDLLVENIISSYLDSSIIEEGYKRP